MLDWKEVPVSTNARSFTGKQFLVFDGMYPIMSLGLNLHTLLTKQYYIWIRPTKYLKARHIRPMKAAIKQFNGCTLFANIAVEDAKSCRFATALGFHARASTEEFIYFERTA